jgi:hypothetical protein
MNTWEHRYVGSGMHDRILGALELCCRRGEMLLIQNKRMDSPTSFPFRLAGSVLRAA